MAVNTEVGVSVGNKGVAAADDESDSKVRPALIDWTESRRECFVAAWKSGRFKSYGALIEALRKHPVFEDVKEELTIPRIRAMAGKMRKASVSLSRMPNEGGRAGVVINAARLNLVEPGKYGF